MKTEAASNPGPYDSEQILIRAIRESKGIDIAGIEKIVEERNLRFYQSLLSVIVEGLLDKHILYDEQSGLYSTGPEDFDKPQIKPDPTI